MVSLIALGLAAGVITGLSPCVLPVLPGVLAASALETGTDDAPASRSHSMRRALLIVAGLITSFTLAILFAGTVLGSIGLPSSLLQSASIIVLVIVGIGLLIPHVGQVLERPFARLASRGPRRFRGSAYWFGIAFGLVFVPCAGPVLAAITVVSATSGVSAKLLVLTLAFALGAAIPLLVIAFFGTTAGRMLRARTQLVRSVAGVVMILTAVFLQFGWSDAIARNVPSYLADVQRSVEDSTAARDTLDALNAESQDTGVAATGSAQSLADCSQDPSVLANCGAAPEFTGITEWLNTEAGKPVSLADRKGKVTLVDFWTYSCINCQRTLPYLKEWQKKYEDAGFTIVGVHSPEFDFERDPANVADQAAKLGVSWPIAIDNDYGTWTAYSNNYWPAHYLIDQDGIVRQVHFGEGAYAETEQLIRQLLGVDGSSATPRPTPSAATDGLGKEVMSPETYLGALRGEFYTHALEFDREATYPGSPAPDMHGVALTGTWTVHAEDITAGRDAGLDLAFLANEVYLVLGGEGTLSVNEPGNPGRTIAVTGAPTLYTLHTGNGEIKAGTLHLGFTPGLQAYAFTFG